MLAYYTVLNSLQYYNAFLLDPTYTLLSKVIFSGIVAEAIYNRFSCVAPIDNAGTCNASSSVTKDNLSKWLSKKSRNFEGCGK
jgi:hypothetical protein